MRNVTRFATATATAGLLALSSTGLFAQNSDIDRQLSDARHEGSVSTAIATNRHLSPFDISVDVQGDTAVLTGNVETDVDKDLAGDVALEMDGIEQVDNRITVDELAARKGDNERTVADRLSDSTTTATVKSKLLWNNSTAGLDITVSTVGDIVSLGGMVDSEATKELAERLAADTDGVRAVHNQLIIGEVDRSAYTAETTGISLSDAWITSKIKSSFLFSRILSGTNISVETEDGAVTLGGKVSNSAEKELAEQTARDIRGVREVRTGKLNIDS